MAGMLKRLWDDLEPETQVVSGTVLFLTIATLVLVGVMLMMFPSISLFSAIGIGCGLETIGLSALAIRMILIRK